MPDPSQPREEHTVPDSDESQDEVIDEAVDTSKPPVGNSKPATYTCKESAPTTSKTDERIAKLTAQRDELESRLLALLDSKSESPDKNGTDKPKPALEAANAIIQSHISTLHAYNEVRDVGQALLGMVAEQRGVRIVDVMTEFGVGASD